MLLEHLILSHHGRLEYGSPLNRTLPKLSSSIISMTSIPNGGRKGGLEADLLRAISGPNEFNPWPASVGYAEVPEHPLSDN